MVGEILVEIVATTAGAGFREAQPLIGPYPSGSPAIFIDQCTRLGSAAAMIGAVGSDDFGRMTPDRLRDDRVDVSAVAVDLDYPTGSAFVRYHPFGARTSVYNIAMSVAARFGWSATVETLIAKASTLPGAIQVIQLALPALQARGGTRSVDPDVRKDLRHSLETSHLDKRLISKADLLPPSGDELLMAAECTDEASALKALTPVG